jgi:hypothetical protein
LGGNKKMAFLDVFRFITAGLTSLGGVCGGFLFGLLSFDIFFSLLLDFRALPSKISQEPFNLFFLQI